MRVLVTGANGFLGSAVVRETERLRLDTIASARTTERGALACDLSDAAAVLKMLRSVSPDAVINCAAVADFSEGALPRQVAVNSLAPGLMANWATQSGAYLLQISATIVHGARFCRVTSSTPIAPDTDYGRSKAIAEDLVESTGCRSAIIRIGGIFGAAGPEHLGINNAIRSARAGSSPTIVGNGSARRNYIHVDDAAAALVNAANESLSGVFRLASRETVSMAAMLQSICDVYLPGQAPRRKPGPEASDQIVDPSPELLPSRSFIDALRADT